MKRIKKNSLIMKKILLYVLIMAIAQCASSQSKILKTDWVFIYYMPYDNDLTKYGEQIIRMIRDSISSDKVVATVQADFDDSLGMMRYIITKDTIIKSHVNSELSAYSKSYEDYLFWVEEKIIYKKRANILLDHGGKLDELCLDVKPEFNFLTVDSLKNVFQKVYQQKKIDLLFMQVCSKGSVEPVYEFKDVANYTLCSQITLGAPNYYYHALFSQLSKHSNFTGANVGKVIMENEREDMYNSYTLVNNSKLDTFFYLFSDFIKSATFQGKLILSAQPNDYYYYNQKYWDLISFLENIVVNDQQNLIAKRGKIIDYIKTQLLVVKLNPTCDEVKGSSGLSLYARGKGDNLKKYKNLDFNIQLKEFPQIEIVK
jgi:hypothetical protein